MIPIWFVTLSAMCACALLARASADTLTGRVVSSTGVGVSDVDIDFKDMITGDSVSIMNGGTDANGDFLVTAPAGLYRVIFTPPQPPTTTHLVTGASAMGTTALDAGVSPGGRMVTGGGTGIPGINLDFVDPATGDDLMVPGDQSGASGDFLVAVPMGPIEVEVRPGEGGSPFYAPRRLDLTLAGNTTLGDIALSNGFFLGGTARRTNGTAIAGADADVVDTTSGETLFTPGDGSNGSGFIEVVVPAGTFDLEVCPPGGTSLVGERVNDVVVAGDTNVGDIVLVTGVELSGQLTTFSGVQVTNGDVDVRDAGTGTAVLTCDVVGDDRDVDSTSTTD